MDQYILKTAAAVVATAYNNPTANGMIIYSGATLGRPHMNNNFKRIDSNGICAQQVIQNSFLFLLCMHGCMDVCERDRFFCCLESLTVGCFPLLYDLQLPITIFHLILTAMLSISFIHPDNNVLLW